MNGNSPGSLKISKIRMKRSSTSETTYSRHKSARRIVTQIILSRLRGISKPSLPSGMKTMSIEEN